MNGVLPFVIFTALDQYFKASYYYDISCINDSCRRKQYFGRKNLRLQFVDSDFDLKCKSYAMNEMVFFVSNKYGYELDEDERIGLEQTLVHCQEEWIITTMNSCSMSVKSLALLINSYLPRYVIQSGGIGAQNASIGIQGPIGSTQRIDWVNPVAANKQRMKAAIQNNKYCLSKQIKPPKHRR